MLLFALACGGSTPASDAAVLADSGAPDDAGLDASSSPFVLPTVAARCSAPADRSSSALAVTDAVPELALARGDTDLALAYVVRAASPALAHFDLQRLTSAGAPTGAAISLGPVDMAIPGQVSVARDGSSYLACTVTVGSVSCFRVDDAGTSRDDLMITDATAIAIAAGPGGVMAAWTAAGELLVGRLGSAGAHVATSGARPSIAATDVGFVVGYTVGAAAYVAPVDASGAPGPPVSLGAARSGGQVAVAFTGGSTGASFIGPSGDAMAAVVSAGTPHTITVGPGASSYGRVAIARASDGFFATWSDFGGTIGGAFVDLSGAVTGAPYAHGVGWDDNAHDVIATDAAIVLATNTTPSATPVDLALVGCP